MKIRFAFALALAILAYGFAAHAQNASGPQMLITWKAVESTAPLAYGGKVLPGADSKVVAAIEVVTPSGQLANLSERTIYWYLDGGLVGGGIGKQTITFTTPGHLEIAALRVEIPDYPTGLLIKTARIQVAGPRVVIVAPYAGNAFAGSALAFDAVPYFFKITDLAKIVYQWSMNGQLVTGRDNPQHLLVNVEGNLPSGSSLAVNLGAQLSNDPLTAARAKVTLTKL